MSDEDEKPLVGDLTGLGKVANSKLVNQVYEDAIAPFARQAGAFGEDAAKTCRLVLAPLQLLAAFQDRIGPLMKRIADAVPEERRQEPPPEILIPALKALSFLPDENPLATLYVELLTRSVDRDRIDQVHPAFIHVIEQLSPDEVRILDHLRSQPIPLQLSRLSDDEIDVAFYFAVKESEKLEGLELDEGGKMMHDISHLVALDLVHIGMKTEAILSPWGRRFVKACVPASASPAL